MSHNAGVANHRKGTGTVRSMSMSVRWRALVAAAAGLVLSSCASNAPQDTFQPKGTNAQKIDDLQRPVFYIAGVIGVIVLAAVTYIIFKHRDRGQAMPEQGHGKASIEYGAIAGSALILTFVAVFTVPVVYDLAEADDAACTINVTGQQWWWEYDYSVGQCGGVDIPEPIITSGQLVFPAGVDVLLTVTSRDVIHSYWIPSLNGKKDAVPGRVHTLRMQADEPGIYAGQCTEFCGLSHARMRMEAVALTQADFATWVENQLQPYTAPAEGTLAAAGEGQFTAQCARCHQVNGLVDSSGNPVLSNPDTQVVSGAAPNLTNLLTRTTFAGATWDLLTEQCRADLYAASPEEFGALYLRGAGREGCLNEVELRRWLRNAPAMKPMYADEIPYRGMPNLNLEAAQIDELIAYLLERK
jgi:cytochrome c oxidase subunit II